MHSKQIIIKDTLLNYYTNDVNTDRSNLVFLHGWGSDSIYWFKSFTPDFLNKFNVYCLDLPGFAKSITAKEDLTVSGFGEFVKEFIEKLDLNRVTLIGHSLGGRIGIKLAASKYNRLHKLVLVNSAGIYHTTKSTKLITKLAGVAKPLFQLSFMQGIRRYIYIILRAEDYLNSPELQKTFVNVVQEDLIEYLPEIKAPTLIIWGSDDDNEYTPLKDGELMNKLISNSKLVVLNGAKHYSFLDQPEKFISELTKFLE